MEDVGRHTPTTNRRLTPSSRHHLRAIAPAAPASARTRFSGIDDGDGLDLDHEIGSGETGNADGRAGRGRHSEIAHADVGALLELVEIGDKGVGLDDVGPGGAGRLETSASPSDRCWRDVCWNLLARSPVG